MPSLITSTTIKMIHLHDKIILASFLALFVSAALEMTGPFFPPDLPAIVYQSRVNTILLAETVPFIRSCSSFLVGVMAMITIIPASFTTISTVLVLARRRASKNNMIRRLLKKFRPTATGLRCSRCNPSPPRRKNWSQVGETPSTMLENTPRLVSSLKRAVSYAVGILRIFVGNSFKRRLMGHHFIAVLAPSVLVLARTVGATSDTLPQKVIQGNVTSSALAAAGPTENKLALTEGDMIMIALTVFFGIFIVTAAIWGPLYFFRQQRADPERQAADDQNGVHSDRATAGDHEAGPRFVGLRQWFRRLSASLLNILPLRASPSEGNPQPPPIILETVSQYDDIVARLAQNEPGEIGSDDEDHLAEFDVPNPVPNDQVNVHESNGLVEFVERRESHMVPISLDDDEQQEDVGEVQSGPSRPGYGGASMAPITKCKTC